MGIYSFTLPHTPPPARGKAVNLRTLLMFDALSLLAHPPFLVFIVCSTLICIPLAYYYGITSMFLGNAGFVATASSMTIGQMSEIVFMLLIPFFFRRLGVKNMILIGMLAWVARYVLFAFGAPDQVAWMLFLGIALHGICYDFFFVTGFMYTDKVADANIRGQAQGMLVFFTQGIGMYFGYWVAYWHHGEKVTRFGELTEAIAASRPEETPGFLQSLTRMFSVEPLNVDPELLSATMDQWRAFWMVPAAMASIIAVIFLVAFWDKMSNYDNGEVTATDLAEAVEREPLA
jgi:MFS family permease